MVMPDRLTKNTGTWVVNRPVGDNAARYYPSNNIHDICHNYQLEKTQ